MTACFVDTFFFLALLNPDDACHRRVREANQSARRMVTSAWVLLEVADHLCAAENRWLFGSLLQALRADKRFEIVGVDEAVLQRATDLYIARQDKDWSLTDCTSFVLMGDREINDALTGDHHFAQAGFTPLLR